jgi:glutamate dehydrogenase
VDPDAVRAYTDKCASGYLNNSVSRRFFKQMTLYDRVAGTEGVAVDVEAFDASEHNAGDDSGALFWVDTAIANSLPQYALEHFARVMQIQGLDIVRTHLDNVQDGEGRSVTMLRMLVDVGDKDPSEELWTRVKRNLKRFKWIDPKVSEHQRRG